MTLTNEPTLDLRVRRTRALLEQAFMDLLELKGFKATTVQDIADRAMVNRATFYDHFEDKYALLDYLIERRFTQLLHEKLSPGASLSRENVRALTLIMCEFLDQTNGHCDPQDRQLLPTLETRMRSLAYDVLLGWLREAGHAKPELVASLTSWAIYGAATDWSQREGHGEVGEFVDLALPLVAASLGV